METMYTLLGTSQQPKLVGNSSERLFVVTRKPLTPLPTMAPEKGVEAPGRYGEKYCSSASAEKRGCPKTKDKKLTFEMGKRVKRNGTTATTVKVVFPGRTDATERDGSGHRLGSELQADRFKSVKRPDLRKTGSLAEIYRRNEPVADKQRKEDSDLTSKSFSQIHTMGGKRERELDDIHGNCMHPHVTRVDILFKPLSNSADSGEEEQGQKTHQQRRRRPVNRQLTKHPSFGSKESISLSTSDLLVRPSKPDPFPGPEHDELLESTESSSAEGTWDSAAYTAKNTRIEFARTLHVPRPFVLRRNHSRWSKRKPQETTRLCSRHLQHIRSLGRRPPSPHQEPTPDKFRDPWLVTPTQRRFDPGQPIPLTSRLPNQPLDVTKIQSNGLSIGPNHPHLHLAAINSVYNCNRLSLPGTVTPPVSETDSLEYLDDFEAFNLKVKMEMLIKKFRQLCRD